MRVMKIVSINSYKHLSTYALSLLLVLSMLCCAPQYVYYVSPTDCLTTDDSEKATNPDEKVEEDQIKEKCYDDLNDLDLECIQNPSKCFHFVKLPTPSDKCHGCTDLLLADPTILILDAKLLADKISINQGQFSTPGEIRPIKGLGNNLVLAQLTFSRSELKTDQIVFLQFNSGKGNRSRSYGFNLK